MKRQQQSAVARVHPRLKRCLARMLVVALQAGIFVLPDSVLANDTAPGSRSEGARGHWAFQRLASIDIPAVKNPAATRTAIDRFILAKLEELGLQPAAAADKRTLIRRASYDLTGLPAFPNELEAFLNDSAPTAYEELVERLLRSP